MAGLAGAAYNTSEYFKKSGWNLNNIASWPGSLLRHFSVAIPGVTSPWLYLGTSGGVPPPLLSLSRARASAVSRASSAGMLFSTFAWHNEDNYLSSINYHHVGAPKQWYGVPGASASAFENVVRRFYKERISEVPDLLHRMNTMFSPSKLKALKVPVYKLRQRAGEFVVTFPQAFHGGFSYGFNCGEAVNFATPHWLDHARLANERYRRVGRLAVLGHDRLIFTLARYVDELDAEGCDKLRDELKRLVREDLVLRPRLYGDGVRDITSGSRGGASSAVPMMNQGSAGTMQRTQNYTTGQPGAGYRGTGQIGLFEEGSSKTMQRNAGGGGYRDITSAASSSSGGRKWHT